MTTKLQEALLQALNTNRAQIDAEGTKVDQLREDRQFTGSAIQNVKAAKNLLCIAITHANSISDPKLAELVKQRMLEIWGE